MKRSSAAAIAAMICLGSGACGDSPRPEPRSLSRDSAGVRIVESRVPVWSEAARWTIDDVPALVIGGGEDGDLHEVAGAVRLSDGRIAVADGGSSQVRFYGEDGQLLMVLGGRGEGPGEFGLLQSLGSGGRDTIWAYDFSLQRFTLVDPTGLVSRSLTLVPRLPAAIPVGRWEDGTFLMAQMWGAGDPAAPLTEGVIRERSAYVRYDGSGALIDTVGLFPGREVNISFEGSRAVMSVVPFARTDSHALVSDGFVSGDQEAYQVGTYSARGALGGLLRWAGPDRTLSSGEADRWRERQVVTVPPDERASLRAYLADLPVPEAKPAYARIVVDSEGALWVGGYSDASEAAQRWDVISRDRGWLGTVHMPARFRPVQIGPDWVLGVARDALDVERVELRALRR